MDEVRMHLALDVNLPLLWKNLFHQNPLQVHVLRVANVRKFNKVTDFHSSFSLTIDVSQLKSWDFIFILFIFRRIAKISSKQSITESLSRVS
jgi:hypothetical protein